MFEKFTEAATQAVYSAMEESRRYEGGYICTEHLLLGLICDTESKACLVLEKLEVSPGRIRQAVKLEVGSPQPPHGPLDPPISQLGKRVLDYARGEAGLIDNNFIGVGTEHILLGLLRADQGVAAKVLKLLGVTLERARLEVKALPAEMVNREVRSKGVTEEDLLDFLAYRCKMVTTPLLASAPLDSDGFPTLSVTRGKWKSVTKGSLFKQIPVPTHIYLGDILVLVLAHLTVYVTDEVSERDRVENLLLQARVNLRKDMPLCGVTTGRIPNEMFYQSRVTGSLREGCRIREEIRINKRVLFSQTTQTELLVKLTPAVANSTL